MLAVCSQKSRSTPLRYPVAKRFPCVQRCMCAKSFQSHLTLCDLMDGNPPGSAVHGILQARILEWGAVPYSRASTQARDQTHTPCSFCSAGGQFTAEPRGKPR